MALVGRRVYRLPITPFVYPIARSHLAWPALAWLLRWALFFGGRVVVQVTNIHTAILSPRFPVVALDHGLAFPKRLDLKALTFNAHVDQTVFDRLGPFHAKHQVVIIAAKLIGVTLNTSAQPRALQQELTMGFPKRLLHCISARK